MGRMPAVHFMPRLSRAELRDLGAAAGMVHQCGEMLSRTNWAGAPACLVLLQHILTAITTVYNRREAWLPENAQVPPPGVPQSPPDEPGAA